MFFNNSQQSYRALRDKDADAAFAIDDQNTAACSLSNLSEKNEYEGLNKLYHPTNSEHLRVYRALSVSLLFTHIFLVSLLFWIVHLYSNIPSGCRYEEPRVTIKGIAEIPVEMEMRQFHTAVRHGDVTPFMGGWNNETNLAWNSILDAGLIKLTPQQASKLPYKTARNPHDPSTYVGILEVFHQLHCLNFIRQGYYIPEERDLYPPPGEVATHADHCFDFLRQNLMCWSDTDIAPISWSPQEDYVPEHDPIKRCTNFDQIHRWAKMKEHRVPN
ncbi:hypothetical protein V8C42DRAFT_360768 [Trichoderma barbatum]